MAIKTCTVDLSKLFLRLRSCSLLFNGPSTTDRHFHSNTLGKACHLQKSCLQNLPRHRNSPTYSFPLWNSRRLKSTALSDSIVSWPLGACGIEELEDFTPLTDEQLQQGIGEQINKSLELGEAGRLFAVVYVRGHQHKVTTEDVIIVKHDFPPNVGDRIRLEKVLVVGGKDFSLIGQPMLSRDVVRVDATVVEKTLSHNRVWLVYRKRKNFQRFRLYRESFTMLVINSIQVAKLPIESVGAIEEEQKARIE
ncbi:large ribosomal subunit protein bL21m-like [Physella acuta]|uniref:large ribosomal subunit protein bL21m-like n=1 Tax=Physella acuta TaxID=109671 RepID=UPI0027DEA39E|nr:large ribosomal subunit protein bL21m-like [Physella acuta]